MWHVKVGLRNLKVKRLTKRPHCTQTVTKYVYVAKSMAYIIDQSCGDSSKVVSCLYKPTSGIQLTPEHSETPQQENTHQLLAVYW